MVYNNKMVQLTNEKESKIKLLKKGFMRATSGTYPSPPDDIIKQCKWSVL
jgi:hypothetical protein